MDRDKTPHDDADVVLCLLDGLPKFTMSALRGCNVEVCVCFRLQISLCGFYTNILITTAYPMVHMPNGHCASTFVALLVANLS